MRAVVIEEDERDPARAIVTYREVVQTATDPEVRGDAALRLASAIMQDPDADVAAAAKAAIAKSNG